MEEARESMELVAGHPALDFANNRRRIAAAVPGEPYAGLLEFARRAGCLSAEDTERLTREAGRRPEEATAVANGADKLAASIRQLVRCHLLGERPPAPALEVLNHAIFEARSHARVVAGGDGAYSWGWRLVRPPSLSRPLWPLARDAAELLVSEDMSRIGCCDADGCDWLFLDASKNRSRRWCDMAVCGNRAKVRRYRERSAAG